MGNGLFAGNMGSLRGDGFIFSRSVRLDRFALAAGHDLTVTGRLGRVYLLKMKPSPLAGSTATLGIQAKTMQDIRNSRKRLLPII